MKRRYSQSSLLTSIIFLLLAVLFFSNFSVNHSPNVKKVFGVDVELPPSGDPCAPNGGSGGFDEPVVILGPNGQPIDDPCNPLDDNANKGKGDTTGLGGGPGGGDGGGGVIPPGIGQPGPGVPFVPGVGQDPDDGLGPFANLCGFAWGGTDELLVPGQPPAGGVGWISFNSQDVTPSDSHGLQEFGCRGVYNPGPPSSCTPFLYDTPQQNVYGVKVYFQDKKLRGYAWSPNVGWIRFGGLSGHPSTPTNPAGDARIVTSTTINNGVLSGWVRACSVSSDSLCNFSGPGAGTTTPEIAGGWDGWISLGGSTPAPGWGVRVFGGVFGDSTNGNSFAWGSNILGWIKWKHYSGGYSLNEVHYCGLFDFDLVNDSPIDIQIPAQGENPAVGITTMTISKTSTSGTEQPVVLRLPITLPPGISSASFPQGAVRTPTVPTTTPLRIIVNAGAVPGQRTFYVTGVAERPGNGIISHTSLVTVNLIAPPEVPAATDLTVTCSAPTPPQPENEFYVNKPIKWKVQVSGAGSPPSVPTPPFTYLATFTTTSGSVQANGILPSSGEITRDYSTIGRKTFSARVTDSHGAVGECTPVSITVKVHPGIIER